jgi:hypothetical protein
VRSFHVFFATSVFLASLCGCGPKKGSTSSAAPATSGIITVNNTYGGTCPKGTAQAGGITASLDGGPVVSIADNSKFEFANVAQGKHTLSVRAVGARSGLGGGVWDCGISVAPGGDYSVLVTCGAKGTVSLVCP